MKKFKRVYIEITNVCNLSCEFCPKTQREGQFLSLESYEAILKELQGYTQHIYLHVMGEPLLHPLLDRFLDKAHESNFYVNLTTNGTLLKEKGPMLLRKPSLRQVNISLHSFSVNEGTIDFNNYFNNIFNFVEQALSKNKPYISLRLWNFDLEGPNQKNLAILKDIEDFFRLPHKIKDQLTPGNGVKLRDNIYLTQAESFEWPSLSSQEETHQGFCYGLRDQLAILVDGTVVPCCLDGEGIINLGNILERPLEEILNSPRSKDFYESFSNRKVVEDLCKRCTFRLRFNN